MTEPRALGPAGRSRWRRGMLVLAGAGLASGCATALAVNVPPAGPAPACVVAETDRPVLVGVALSGGGTRAALFAAAGLEALGRLRAPDGGSVLEQVTHLSSVSGGSVAAAYYASHKPPRGVPLLTADGRFSPDYEAFFGRMRETLGQNLEAPLIRRQLLSFRWLNSALAARSLAEVVSERVLGEREFGELTFQELGVRERSGNSPRLIVNATLFNNGRRLVMTTLPPGAMRYDFFRELRKSLARRGVTDEIPASLEQRWAGLLPLTPLDLGIDPCPMALAAAVSGSASFPPFVGPITFRVGEENQYWHAGDGGLYENQGIESLLFPFLKRLQEGRARRALILAFDASYPFSVGYRVLSRRAEPFSLFTYDFSRIPSIMEERATTYQGLFFRSLQLEGVFPDDHTLRFVRLSHTDAIWQADLRDLPDACRGEPLPLSSPEAIQDRLAGISTRFWLPSACDRELLATAAAKVVAQQAPEILGFLADTNR